MFTVGEKLFVEDRDGSQPQEHCLCRKRKGEPFDLEQPVFAHRVAPKAQSSQDHSSDGHMRPFHASEFIHVILSDKRSYG